MCAIRGAKEHRVIFVYGFVSIVDQRVNFWDQTWKWSVSRPAARNRAAFRVHWTLCITSEHIALYMWYRMLLQIKQRMGLSTIIKDEHIIHSRSVKQSVMSSFHVVTDLPQNVQARNWRELVHKSSISLSFSIIWFCCGVIEWEFVRSQTHQDGSATLYKQKVFCRLRLLSCSSSTGSKSHLNMMISWALRHVGDYLCQFGWGAYFRPQIHALFPFVPLIHLHVRLYEYIVTVNSIQINCTWNSSNKHLSLTITNQQTQSQKSTAECSSSHRVVLQLW